MGQLLDTLEGLTAHSPLAQFAQWQRALQRQPRREGFRPPDAAEIVLLERLGNYSPDWSRVLFREPFHPRRIIRSSFFGECRIGALQRQNVEVEAGLALDAGIYQSTLMDCEIGDDCFLMNVGALAQTVLEHGAIVFNVQLITCGGAALFGCGASLPLGIETGGRDVKIFAELDVELAARLARCRADRALHEQYADFIAQYLERIRSRCSYIGAEARLTQLKKLSDVYIGAGALIDGAGVIANSCIYSAADEPSAVRNGSTLDGAIVQWGCTVDTLASVRRALLCEHCTVERHAGVSDSIIGPNSSIGEGEITAALCGPFVGAHHQSLLIAALWPEGRGNIGYGAKVGSNHTGKTADQEIWPGEGTFFGLGCNVKFPSDFSRAPYSIIASGVDTLPQRVEMPFSLINSRSTVISELSPAINEILPAWVLSDNLYMIKRNEQKYAKRNRARRARFTLEVFRPEIIELMRAARNALDGIRHERPVYTESDIPGLGKNFLLNANRNRAIETYDFFIRVYALRGLQRRLLAGARPDGLLTLKTDDPRWEHERGILNQLFDADADLKLALEELLQLEETIAFEVQRSKEKDDRRGARIIDDYREAHPPAASDPFIVETWNAALQLKNETLDLIEKLK